MGSHILQIHEYPTTAAAMPTHLHWMYLPELPHILTTNNLGSFKPTSKLLLHRLHALGLEL